MQASLPSLNRSFVFEAGKPYLVKVAANANLSTTAFDGITVSKNAVPFTSTNVDFIPTLGKTTIEGTAAASVLFLAAGNKLKNPTKMPTDMKGFRAYFQLKGDAISNARSFSLNLGDGEATGISQVENGKLRMEHSVYDMQGRKVNAQPNSQLKKGVYIVGGKKVIIK